MKIIMMSLVFMSLATAMHADKVCIRVSDDVIYCTDDDGTDEYIYTMDK